MQIIPGKLVTTSLDGTIRQWKLDEIVHPEVLVEIKIEKAKGTLTREEEEELAELMEFV